MTTHRLGAADLEFERQFACGEFPPKQFDHRAHLRLACVHLALHGPERATETFRDALRAFIAHHGIDPAKYHETLTIAWLHVVWLHMQRLGAIDGAEDFVAHAQTLHDPKVMLVHYTPARLFSEQARAAWVAPDLEPIPELPARAPMPRAAERLERP